MVLKNYATGLQHVGVPTKNMKATVEYYEKLGFETALETMNGKDKVVFLKLQNLMVEAYETETVKPEAGAIDHIAIDVTNIEAVYSYICANGLNNTGDTIHTLMFWEKGVRYFTIEGPNKERVEFSQIL